MLRRSILEISSRRSVGRIPTQITTQIPLYLSSRKEFSVASQPNPSNSSGSTGKSGGNSSKVVIGSIALGAAALTVYQTGYLDKFIGKEQKNNLNTDVTDTVDEEKHKLSTINQDLHDAETVGEQVSVQEGQASQISSPNVEHGEKKFDSDPYYGRKEGQIDHEVQVSESEAQKIIPEQEDIVPGSHPSTSNNSRESFIAGAQVVKPSTEPQEAVQTSPTTTQDASVIQENVLESEQPQHLETTSTPEDALSNGIQEPKPLLDEYLLRKEAEETAAISSDLDKDTSEPLKGTDDVYMSKDGKLVLDFLQAIHTAEKRQAELDAHIFSEEKRAMKEKYEKELKDARARELMYAERETILEKELHKEKIKAAVALKSLQEKLEEDFRIEIEKKETETEQEVKKLQDLAKAELAAAIASEKAYQIEKMAEANLNINALCMAFYARSEEARKSHSVHKLALGALALEDALSKGLPIQKEVDSLNSYLDGIDKDSLLGLVMASLPEDTLKNGTDTTLQLHHKFDDLKGTLRHFSLMPQGGGGILAHSLARVASMLKVKEADQSGDGIESLINRVESFLADGKLVEAAETLENGLKGSQAAEVVSDWVRQARNRAITEQALTLLQSYATSVSLT